MKTYFVGGLGLPNTAYARVVEAICTDPAISTTLMAHQSIGLKVCIGFYKELISRKQLWSICRVIYLVSPDCCCRRNYTKNRYQNLQQACENKVHMQAGERKASKRCGRRGLFPWKKFL